MSYMLCQGDKRLDKVLKWLVDFIAKGIFTGVVLAMLAWMGAMMVKHWWVPVRELWWKHWPVLPWIFEHGWWVHGRVRCAWR